MVDVHSLSLSRESARGEWEWKCPSYPIFLFQVMDVSSNDVKRMYELNPKHWKIACGAPMYKNGAKDNFSNFKPSQ